MAKAKNEEEDKEEETTDIEHDSIGTKCVRMRLRKRGDLNHSTSSTTSTAVPDNLREGETYDQEVTHQGGRRSKTIKHRAHYFAAGTANAQDTNAENAIVQESQEKDENAVIAQTLDAKGGGRRNSKRVTLVTSMSTSTSPMTPVSSSKDSVQSQRHCSPPNKDQKPLQMQPFPLSAERDGLTAVAEMLRGRKNVLVLAGAGISVSCGIPDFRSANGLYATLDTAELGLQCAEEIFDLEVFQDDPRPFYKFAKHLYPEVPIRPSLSHFFLYMLQRHGMLLRVYTQNIDGLEELAGVSKKNLVYAHGSLRWVQCTRCQVKKNASEFEKEIREGIVPRCKKPLTSSTSKMRHLSQNQDPENGLGPSASMSSPPMPPMKKRPRRGKVSASQDGRVDGGEKKVLRHDKRCCDGVIKPGVTFFGETLDDRVKRQLESDHCKADALIVIGTSLSVAPMSKVIQFLSPDIPRILINRNHVSPPPAKKMEECHRVNGTVNDQLDYSREGYVFDAYLLGNCDFVTRVLAKELGWTFTRMKATKATAESEEDLEVNKMKDKQKNKNRSDNNICFYDAEPFDGNEERGGFEEPVPMAECDAVDSLNSSLQQQNEEGSDMEVRKENKFDMNITSFKGRTCLPPNVVERTFLFPGAVVGGKEDKNFRVRSDSEEMKEVVHCDGCTKQINGIIMKCINCFDYDLCTKCYPLKRLIHFDGIHTFVEER